MNVNVRIPADLHKRVVERASADLRSLNSEILWLLTRALDSLRNEDTAPSDREPDR